MTRLNPYIHFNGNAEEAFTFYKTVFGGEFAKLLRYKDIASAEYPIADKDATRLMHVALAVGKDTILMGSDVLETMGRVNESDNRNSITISTDSRTEADELFYRLSKNGTVEMPMADGPFGAYFGMFSDRFGVQWMIEYTSGARA